MGQKRLRTTGLDALTAVYKGFPRVHHNVKVSSSLRAHHAFVRIFASVTPHNNSKSLMHSHEVDQ